MIIAEDVEGEALTALVVNKLRGVLNVCAVKAPGFGDRRKAMLGDIAVADRRHADQRRPGHQAGKPGRSSSWAAPSKITVDKNDTTIVEGAGKQAEIQNRIQQIRNQIEETESDYDREKFQERLAKLTGGVAIISVGAGTEADMKQKKARVEDALHATRAAVEEGILPGGGVALLRCREAVEKVRGSAKGDEKIGVDIVLHCRRAPMKQIADNCGIDGSVVVDEVSQKPTNTGYDANAGEVRRHVQGRHHRPGEGRAQRPDQRRQHRRTDADDRGLGHQLGQGRQEASRPGRRDSINAVGAKLRASALRLINQPELARERPVRQF